MKTQAITTKVATELAAADTASHANQDYARSLEHPSFAAGPSQYEPSASEGGPRTQYEGTPKPDVALEAFITGAASQYKSE